MSEMALKSVLDESPPSATDRSAYAEIGAICLRGVFTEWVETLRAGV